jgi:hypothetical protein
MSIASAMNWVARRAGKGIRCKAASVKMPIAMTTAPEAVGKGCAVAARFLRDNASTS